MGFSCLDDIIVLVKLKKKTDFTGMYVRYQYHNLTVDIVRRDSRKIYSYESYSIKIYYYIYEDSNSIY